MRKKYKVSLSLKLTIIVVLASVIAVISLAFFNINIEKDKEYFLEAQFDKAASLVHDINTSVLSQNLLNDKEALKENITDYKKWNEKILGVNINLANNESELVIFFSFDNNSIEKTSNSYMKDGEDLNYKCFYEGDTWYIANEQEQTLVVLSPINQSGVIIGTYEIIIIDSSYDYLNLINELRTNNFVFTSAPISLTLPRY